MVLGKKECCCRKCMHVGGSKYSATVISSNVVILIYDSVLNFTIVFNYIHLAERQMIWIKNTLWWYASPIEINTNDPLKGPVWLICNLITDMLSIVVYPQQTCAYLDCASSIITQQNK